MEIRQDYSNHRVIEQNGAIIHVRGNTFIPGVNINTDTTVAVIGSRDIVYQEITPSTVDEQEVAPVDEFTQQVQRKIARDTFGTMEARIEMAQIRVRERMKATPIVGA